MAIRQAIPFEEVARNMRNQSTCKNRYSRRDTFISELEADGRLAVGIITFGTLTFVAIGFVLALLVSFMTGKAEAHQGQILIKSELSPAQIKALNIMPVKPEKYRAR